MNDSPRSHFAHNAAMQREIRAMLARFGEPSRSWMRPKINADRAAVRHQAGDFTAEQADATAGLHVPGILRLQCSGEIEFRLSQFLL